MVDKIIADYLKANKRLVVPQFGAFIHKENDGTFAFVPFLKKDDGVLIRLIGSSGEINPADAQTAIDRFVSDIKKSVATQGAYAIEGIGSLKADPDGNYYLASGGDPSSDAVPAEQPARGIPQAEPIQTPVAPPAPVRPAPATIQPEQPRKPAQTQQPVQQPRQTTEPPRPSPPAMPQRPAPNVPPRPTNNGFPGQPQQMRQTQQPGQQRPSFQQPPAPGQGNQPPVNRRPQPGYPPRRPMGGRPAPKRTKADGFIAIAIIVAVVALAVMIFGYMVSREGPDIKSIILPAQTDTTTQSATVPGNE